MKLNWLNTICLSDDEIQKYFANTNTSKILLFLAKGFDPRMCEIIRILDDIFPSFDVCLIEFTDGSNPEYPRYQEFIKKNIEELRKVKEEYISLRIERPLSTVEVELKNKLCYDLIMDYDEIIIDISAMPQTLSFNLIKHLLQIKASGSYLSVMLCENSQLDDSIQPIDLSDNARYLNGFNVSLMEMDSVDDSRIVWIPFVNNRCEDEIDKIFYHIMPDEICPVLPFPSRNPRRSDEIILSDVGNKLFNTFEVEKRNIIYVPENNVVQIYKKLCLTVDHYNKVLDILGPSRYVFTVCANKTGELGAVLASLEITSAGITNSFAIVENGGYLFDNDRYDPTLNSIHYINLSKSIFEW